MMCLNDIVDLIGREESVAVFMEEDPRETEFESALYFGLQSDLRPFEFYSMLKYHTVGSMVTRLDGSGNPVLCILLVD